MPRAGWQAPSSGRQPWRSIRAAVSKSVHSSSCGSASGADGDAATPRRPDRRSIVTQSECIREARYHSVQTAPQRASSAGVATNERTISSSSGSSSPNARARRGAAADEEEAAAEEEAADEDAAGCCWRACSLQLSAVRERAIVSSRDDTSGSLPRSSASRSPALSCGSSWSRSRSRSESSLCSAWLSTCSRRPEPHASIAIL